MATDYTKEWTDFFTGSGIPVDVATTYALIFYENRIQKNMLLDLNKEYLRDMGITVMGDVIAILRYAKVIYKKYMSEQILVGPKTSLPPDEKNNLIFVPGDKPMKAQREIQITNCHKSPKKNFQLLESDSEAQPTTKLKKLDKVKMEVKLKELEVRDSNAPKVRRVLPENEAAYTIKMPKGNTEGSKKISNQVKKREVKTVFERLGESSVSSTTSEGLLPNYSLNNSLTNLALNKDRNSSVFSRLGEKTLSVVSSTSSIDCVDTVRVDQLPYVGILKAGSVSKIATMRADDEDQKLPGRQHSEASRGISVKQRLGVTPTDFQGNRETDSAGEKRIVGKSGNDDASTLKDGKWTLSVKKGNLETRKSPLPSGQNQRLQVMKNMKRKLSTASIDETTSPKRVTFGSTTLRLIPTSEATCSVKKPSPNFTLGMLNKGKKSFFNLKTGSGVLQGRLGKRQVGKMQAIVTAKRTCSIRDRLG